MFKRLFGKKTQTAVTSEQQRASQLGVDLEMNYCPECGDEYRKDIKRCVGCEVRLISGKEKLSQVSGAHARVARRSMEISKNDDLLVIRNGKLKDLKQFQILLGRASIPALLTAAPGGCSSG